MLVRPLMTHHAMTLAVPVSSEITGMDPSQTLAICRENTPPLGNSEAMTLETPVNCESVGMGPFEIHAVRVGDTSSS